MTTDTAPVGGDPFTALLGLAAPSPAAPDHLPLENRAWPRVVVDQATWLRAIQGLEDGTFSLLGLWGDVDHVHAALYAGGRLAVLSLPVPDAAFPSIGARHPPAIRLERAVQDIFGLRPEGLADLRPWLDHGRWRDDVPPVPAAAYPFLPVNGDGLHQIPVGPVHAGIIEPGHFRFTCNGETVVRLEERLGYVHKGIEVLMSGADLARGATLAGRVSGDSTVAYAFGYARAVEIALGVRVPPRATWLRGIMAELERLANHIGDVGAICNDAAFSLMLTHCAMLREQVLRTAAACFGHRLMMDRIVPGGVATDLTPEAATAIHALVAQIRAAQPRLLHLYDETPSLQDRTTTTGIVSTDLARRFAAGGYVGRAAGRDFDARRDLAYAPYDTAPLRVAHRQDGDVNARVWIRLEEIANSLDILDHLIAQLPAGSVAVDLPAASGEGLSVTEGFRGDILIWIDIADGIIRRCHLRDPSWFTFPLLEAAINGNIVADFPICNKSFNCSYSGHDL